MANALIDIEKEYISETDWQQGYLKNLEISSEKYLQLQYVSVPLSSVNASDYCNFSVSSPGDDWIEKIKIENQNGEILLDFYETSYASGGYDDNTELIIETTPGDILTINVTVNAGSSSWKQYLSWGNTINNNGLEKIGDLYGNDGCPWTHTYQWEVPKIYGNHLISWWEHYSDYKDCCGSYSYAERRDFTLHICAKEKGYLTYGYINIPNIDLDYICDVENSLVKWEEVDVNLKKLTASISTNGECNIILKNIFARGNVFSSGNINITKLARFTIRTNTALKLTTSPLGYSKVKTSIDGGNTWDYIEDSGSSIPGIKKNNDLKDKNLQLKLELFSLRKDVNVRIKSLFIKVSGIKRIYVDNFQFLTNTDFNVNLTPFIGCFQGKVKKREENAVGAKILAVNIDREIVDGVVNSDENGDFYIEVKRNEQYHIIAQYKDDEGEFHAKSFPYQYPIEIR